MRGLLETVRVRFGIARELIQLLWMAKVWWLIPLVLILLVFSVLVILAQSPMIAPVIYTLF